MNEAPFFAYARERYGILLNRQGGIKPLTHDAILKKYRFCNVFREDDKTTAWIKSHVRYPLRLSESVLFAIAVARWFNRIETLERISSSDTSGCPLWHPNVYDRSQIRRRLQGISPLVTGAYMVKTPTGMDKLDGVLHCLDDFHARAPDMVKVIKDRSLENAWEVVQSADHIGPFNAYEIVTDLRHTALLNTAPDVNTWANPGPGAKRGLGRLLGGGKDMFTSSADDRRKMIGLMGTLLALSRFPENWPESWPVWELREVEHTLCEFDKYERVRLGEGAPKQKFTGS